LFLGGGGGDPLGEAHIQSAYLIVVLVFVGVGGPALAARLSKAHPWLCAVVVLVVTALEGIILYCWFGWFGVMRSAWFYLCALGAHWTITRRDGAQTFRGIEWERFIAVPFGILSFFSIFVYGHAAPQFGGGAPLSAIIHFEGEVGKLLSAESMRIYLVDQTDQGYYFTRRPYEHHAIFVPRVAVRMLEYDSELVVSTSLPSKAPVAPNPPTPATPKP